MSDSPIQIGKYKIEGELGRGAMGVVYQAFDLVVERQVALKTICVSTADGIDLLEILRREAKSVGRFEHPNIVTLFDAGELRITPEALPGAVSKLVLDGKPITELF